MILIQQALNFLYKYNALNASIHAGFSGMPSTQNVLPMFYPRNENPRKLNVCKGFKGVKVIPLGFEPRTTTLKV